MLNHPVANPGKMAELGMAKGLDGEYHPRVIALGGDHTIVRPLASSYQ
jgi:agmatinase